MKRILTFTIILIMLTSCTPPQTQAGLPNPASVYCEQNGNKLEIRTATDGSQSGVCFFPDGSECDEWAYYREECGPAAQISTTPAAAVEAVSDASGSGPGGSAGTGGNSPGSSMSPGATEAIVDWWGVIKSTELGSQYDDYFERQDLEQIIYFGIDSMDPAVNSQIEALRDSGRIVHLYGTLVSNVPDYNGSQILVDRIEIDE
jgi:putative hemolysin